jgi:hypothetical protein
MLAPQLPEVRQTAFVKGAGAVVEPYADRLTRQRFEYDQVTVVIAIHVPAAQLDGRARAQEMERGLQERAQGDADFLGIPIGIMSSGSGGCKIDLLVTIEIR